MKFGFTMMLAGMMTGVFAQQADSIPKIILPGLVSAGDYESHPAFSPTGDTLYFIKCSYDLKISAICVSYRHGTVWSAPVVAPFSGRYMDADPFVARDGKTVFFMSNRPILRDGSVKPDTDIWKVEWQANGWSAPIHLEAPVNSEADEYYPTQADNGNLYFASTRKGGKGGSDVYRCRFENEKFLDAENLGDSINTPGNEFEAFIAPDESYLIYNATPAGLNKLDFYLSTRVSGRWSAAKKLPFPISSDAIDWSPKVTRDGRFFYFSSTRSPEPQTPARPYTMAELDLLLRSPGNGMSDIYRVDFSAVKKALAK